MYIFKRWSIFSIGEGTGEFKEFIKFLRPRIAIFGTGLALLGYLIFNPINTDMLFVSVCAFFATVAAYSINLLTDKEEDASTGRELNYFVINQKKGQVLVCLFIALGVLSSALLSKTTMLFYGLIILLALSYSLFRIKKISLVKNISTGFILTLLFLFGASPYLRFTLEMVIYYLIISFYVFVLSLLTDLRDYDEDKAGGIKTLSVLLGRDNTTKIVYSSFFLFLAFVIISNSVFLYPLFIFAPLAFLFLRKGEYKKAQSYLMYSLLLGPVVLVII